MAKKENSTNAIIAILLIIGVVLAWQWYSTKQSPVAEAQFIFVTEINESGIEAEIGSKPGLSTPSPSDYLELKSHAIIEFYPNPNGDDTLEPTRQIAELLVESNWFKKETERIKHEYELRIARLRGQLDVCLERQK